MRWALRKLGVDESLIRTVMALYTEACTVVSTDAGLSFEVTVGLHQGPVYGCCFQQGEKWSSFRVAVC